MRHDQSKPARRLFNWSISTALLSALPLLASSMTVGELLHEESVAMLRAQRQAPSGVVTPAFELVGIWGVEPRLHAQLRYRGQLVEFVQGQKTAQTPFEQSFHLLAIQPPCLTFRFKGTRKRVCIRERRT